MLPSSAAGSNRCSLQSLSRLFYRPDFATVNWRLILIRPSPRRHQRHHHHHIPSPPAVDGVLINIWVQDLTNAKTLISIWLFPPTPNANDYINIILSWWIFCSVPPPFKTIIILSSRLPSGRKQRQPQTEANEWGEIHQLEEKWWTRKALPNGEKLRCECFSNAAHRKPC